MSALAFHACFFGNPSSPPLFRISNLSFGPAEKNGLSFSISLAGYCHWFPLHKEPPSLLANWHVHGRSRSAPVFPRNLFLSFAYLIVGVLACKMQYSVSVPPFPRMRDLVRFIVFLHNKFIPFSRPPHPLLTDVHRCVPIGPKREFLPLEEGQP